MSTKRSAESCRFVEVCVTFEWTSGTKGLSSQHIHFLLAGCRVETFKLDVPSVDTHRPKPSVSQLFHLFLETFVRKRLLKKPFLKGAIWACHIVY